jgi:hypothetical protein
MAEFKLIGMILHPEGNYENDVEGIKDYNVISKGNEESFELLKNKYKVDSDNIEWFDVFDDSVEYVFDEDADGYYLFERV